MPDRYIGSGANYEDARMTKLDVPDIELRMSLIIDY